MDKIKLVLVLPSAMAITAITAKNGHMALMAMANGYANMASERALKT